MTTNELASTGMQSGILDSLNRFSRLAKEFEQESDRGCAVLMLCLLEESLRKMFEALLHAPNQAEYFCPRGRLSVSVKNAVALGLLSDRQRQAFQGLIDIRNIFAHNVTENMRFESEAVRKILKTTPTPVVYPTGTVTEETARQDFVLRAAVLWGVVVFKTEHVQKILITPDPTQGTPAKSTNQPPE